MKNNSDNKIFDDEIDYVSKINAFRAGFRAAVLNLDKLVQNSKLNINQI